LRLAFARQVMEDAVNGRDRKSLPKRMKMAFALLVGIDSQDAESLRDTISMFIEKTGDDPERAYHYGLVLGGVLRDDDDIIARHTEALDELNIRDLMQRINNS